MNEKPEITIITITEAVENFEQMNKFKESLNSTMSKLRWCNELPKVTITSHGNMLIALIVGEAFPMQKDI
jgi:hypothetical protein